MISSSPTGKRFPVISALSGVVKVRDLRIASGGLVSQTGGTLEIHHDFRNAGTYDATGGTIVFAKTGGGNAFAAPGTNQFNNVVIDSDARVDFGKKAEVEVLVRGDWINDGSAVLVSDHATKVIFNGTTEQVVGGAIATEFDTLVLENKEGVSLPVNVKVDGVISGTGAFNLVVQSGETLTLEEDLLEKSLKVKGDAIFKPGSTLEIRSSKKSLHVDGKLNLGDKSTKLKLTGALDRSVVIASAACVQGEFEGYPNGSKVSDDPAYYIKYRTEESPNLIEITSEIGTTSSGVDVRAFQTAEGVVVEFVARDVEEDGSIQLALMDNQSNSVWRGSAAVTAGPEFFARFTVPELELGKSYDFMVRDEVGKWWDAPGVTVQAFAAEMTSATLSGVELKFDSLPNHEYEILWSAALGDAWSSVTNVTATADFTTITVAYPDTDNTAGFFRVRMK